MENLSLASPEILLLSATSLILVVSLFTDATKQIVYWLCQATLVATLFLSYGQVGDEAMTVFSGAYTVDPLSAALKCWILLISIGILLYSRDYLVGRDIARGEYYVLAMFAIGGMMIMVSAKHMLSIYLGLELLGFTRSSHHQSGARGCG